MKKIKLLTTIGSKASKICGRTQLKIKKHSPEILLGIGIVSFVGTVITACNATLHCEEIIDQHKEKIEKIHEAKEIANNNEDVEYTQEMIRKDLGIQYVKTGAKLLKLYAPAIALGTLSITSILCSRNIMNNRYLGVLSAYNGLSQIFNEYRERVREEYGENMDRHFRYGTTYETIVEKDVDENGNKIKTKTEVEKMDPSKIDPKDTTARWFDSSNPNWDKSPNYNLMWLQGQQNMLNDLLQTRGHVFLNEVYHALGIDHTPEGAVLGWMKGYGDDCIDFGLYDPRKDKCRKFINGLDNVILLEFNHNGVIYDKI